MPRRRPDPGDSRPPGDGGARDSHPPGDAGSAGATPASDSRRAAGHREAFRALVSGRVQGVGFRWSAQRAAAALGLSGYVMNLDDGSVETYAEGAPEALAAYLAWLHEGPPGARVDDVRSAPTAANGYYKGFVVDF